MSMRRDLLPEENKRLLKIYRAHPEMSIDEVLNKYASDEFWQVMKEVEIENKIMKLEDYEDIVINGSRFNKYPYELSYLYNNETKTLIVRYQDYICKKSNLDKVPYCVEHFGAAHSFRQKDKLRDPIFKLDINASTISLFKEDLIYNLKVLLDFCKGKGIESSKLTTEEVTLFEVGKRVFCG